MTTPPARFARLAAAFRRFDGWVAAAEGFLLVALLGVLVVAGFWQVVQRNLGTAASSWVDTFNRHLVLWIGLLGAMLATREGKHVNIEAVRKFLPRAAERWVEVAIQAFAALISGAFAWAAFLYVREEFRDPKTLFTVPSLGLPVRAWVTETILPAAFAVIALRFLAGAAATALGIEPPKAPAGKPEGGAAHAP